MSFFTTLAKRHDYNGYFIDSRVKVEEGETAEAAFKKMFPHWSDKAIAETSKKIGGPFATREKAEEMASLFPIETQQMLP